MDRSEPGYAQAAPRGFVPWGLPGPTRGRRDAAALASKTKGTARMGGRVGVGPTDYTSPFPMQPSGLGRPWALKRTPGKLIMSNIIFFMDGEVRNYKGEL